MLYRVFVEEVDGTLLVMRVTALDLEPVPTGLVFAFARICEPLVGIVQCTPSADRKRAPLAKEVGLDDYLDANFLKKHARGFLVSVEREVLEKSVSIRVVATDACWIEHLKRGMRYETGSAHAEGDADPWIGPLRIRGDTERVLATDPNAGTRLAKPDDQKVGRYVPPTATVSQYIVPVEGPSYYVLRKPPVYDRTRDGNFGTSDDHRFMVRSLIGEPIIFQIGKYPVGVGCLVDLREKNDTAVVFSERSDSYGIHTFRLDDQSTPGRVHYIGRALYEERRRIVPSSSQKTTPPSREEEDTTPVEDSTPKTTTKTTTPKTTPTKLPRPKTKKASPAKETSATKKKKDPS